MNSKLIILFAIIGALTASSYHRDKREVDMKFNEANSVVHEKISGDDNKEVIKTPDHGNREGVEELKNCKKNYVVSKPLYDHYCYVRDKEDHDGKCGETKKGLEKTGGIFPEYHIEEYNNVMLPGPLNPKFEGDEEIKKFCGERKRVTPVEIRNEMRKIEKKALEMGRAAKHNARKRAVVREFMACTNASTMKIMTCPGDKLHCKCKVRRSWCTYFIKCPMELSAGGFQCKGLHKMESPVCCDYDC